MAKTGEVIWGKVMGTKIKFLVTSEDSNGELLQMEIKQDKDGFGPPAHFHTAQVEDYKILSGQLSVTVAGETLVLNEGDTYHIPINTTHTFAATSDEPCRYIVDHRPALGFEDFMVTLFDLDWDGRVNKKGLPPFMHFTAILNRYRGEQFVAGPPKIAQIVLGIIGGGLAKVTRWETLYRSKAREDAGLEF
jgi:mannose-6-phosphate isomerase-like protein (cupin superfamily)